MTKINRYIIINFRHTTIKDFQTRLEQLSALAVNASPIPSTKKCFLDLKVSGKYAYSMFN